jgi:gliding motility-associated-like protein
MLVVTSDGEETSFSAGEEFSGEAPVTVRLYANAEEVEGYALVCVWSFTKEDETEPFLVRYENEVEIVLEESGTTRIQPVITYTSKENSDIYWEFGVDTYAPFSVILAESSLEVPNAFSPNGDGINDYFNVYNTKSIVSFNAAIYNRWGQQLYSWGIDEMDCENCGWDGTYKGKHVRPGVYFVVVNAKGADGIEYEIRRDVNLLRNYYGDGGEK